MVGDKVLKRKSQRAKKRMISYGIIFIVFTGLGIHWARNGKAKLIEGQAVLKNHQIIEGINKEEIPKEKFNNQYICIKKKTKEAVKVELEDLYMKQSIKVKVFSEEESVVREDGVYIVNRSEEKETRLIGLAENTKVKAYQYTTYYDEEVQQYVAEIAIQFDTVYVHKVYQDANDIYIDLKRPKEVYDHIVVVDAGHGGKDTGSIYEPTNIYEKEINLAMVIQLRELLKENDIKVYYTRLDDTTVYLNPRADLASHVDADFMLSLHCNSSVHSGATGFEVLYNDNKDMSKNSKEIASVFLNALEETKLLKNRGLVDRTNSLHIMERATVPVVLIEIGFVSNYNDVQIITSGKSRRELVYSIYEAILRYYGTMKGIK